MIAVCVKWVDLHPEVDSLSGEMTTDDRRRGFSAADRAALEIALRLAEVRGTDVVLLSVAPPTAEESFRELAASGAASIVRVDAPTDTDSATVAASLAAALPADVDLVVTGDMSLDRGSGSVPAFMAANRGWAQGLGLIAVDVDSAPLAVVRRLDGGRREHLRLDGPAVISVEGSVARLRRAGLPDVIAARSMPIDVAPVHGAGVTMHADLTTPVRPRARVLPAPDGDRALGRIVELTGALVERTPPRRVEAEPAEAAATIVEQLRAWGYIE